jgi:anti-sigma regulatory factor (Ser/Thr protein kinase)
MAGSSSGTETLELPSSCDVLERVDELTLKHASEAGFDENAAMEIAIAAIEAATNAIVHGNERRVDELFTVEYRWGPGTIEIEVHDGGEGFDLTCVVDPTDPEHCMETSGRGIFIMREVMDTVEFDTSKETGTTVIMRRSV